MQICEQKGCYPDSFNQDIKLFNKDTWKETSMMQIFSISSDSLQQKGFAGNRILDSIQFKGVVMGILFRRTDFGISFQ